MALWNGNKLFAMCYITISNLLFFYLINQFWLISIGIALCTWKKNYWVENVREIFLTIKEGDESFQVKYRGHVKKMSIKRYANQFFLPF